MNKKHLLKKQINKVSLFYILPVMRHKNCKNSVLLMLASSPWQHDHEDPLVPDPGPRFSLLFSTPQHWSPQTLNTWFQPFNTVQQFDWPIVICWVWAHRQRNDKGYTVHHCTSVVFVYGTYAKQIWQKNCSRHQAEFSKAKQVWRTAGNRN